MKKIFIKRPSTIPFTRTGYEQVIQEKKQLESERPQAVDHLKKAREMGDLSENGYYKAARARLSFVDARLRHLNRLVRLGRVVVPLRTGRVEIGSHVTVHDGKKELKLTIVGGYESDPSKHTISHISPLGKAILGRSPGAVVDVTTPTGMRRFTIVDIS